MTSILSESSVRVVTTVFSGKNYWDKYVIMNKDALNAASATFDLDNNDLDEMALFIPEDINFFIRNTVSEYKYEYDYEYEHENPVIQFFSLTYVTVCALPVVRNSIQDSIELAEERMRQKDIDTYEEHAKAIEERDIFEVGWVDARNVIDGFMSGTVSITDTVDLIKNIVLEEIF
jgi:hypothetical protein